MSDMTSLDIFNALKTRHPVPEWIFLGEVRTRTGFQGNGPATLDSARSIDAFAMHTWKSKGYRRVAYEIKVSRGDLIRELRDPKKRVPAYFLSHQFYFAFPAGLFQWTDVKYGELDGCGLLEVLADGSIHELRRADMREAWPMPESFIASLLRQAMGRFEEQREESFSAHMNSLFGEEPA